MVTQPLTQWTVYNTLDGQVGLIYTCERCGYLIPDLVWAAISGGLLPPARRGHDHESITERIIDGYQCYRYSRLSDVADTVLRVADSDRRM